MENNIISRNQISCVILDFDGVITNIDVDWDLLRERASNMTGALINSLLAFFDKYHGTDVFYMVSNEVELFEEKALEDATAAPNAINTLKKM